MFHAGWLNNLWQRIFLESMSIGLAVKDHLNGLMRQAAEAYLDGNLSIKASQVLQSSIS